jgi:hypothetical protein
MMRRMLAIISIVLAGVSILLARVLAGRTAAITVTGISTMLTALVLPPSLSFHIESSTDAAALVVQGLVGLAIASGIRPRKPRETYAASRRHEKTNRAEVQHSLSDIAHKVMRGDPALGQRLGDLEVFGDIEFHGQLSAQELERIVSDLLRVSFSLKEVERVGVYTGRQPSSTRITVVASYNLSRTSPHVYSLGQTDDRCTLLQTNGWPRNCSARWFDNGYAYVYQVSIEATI